MPRPSNDVIAPVAAVVVVLVALAVEIWTKPVSLWEDRDDV